MIAPGRRQFAHRGGFSLLEVMVVVAIVVVLGGLLVIGLRSVGGSGKKSQTLATMGTLRGMLGEYENATKFKTPPTCWIWFPSDGGGNFQKVFRDDTDAQAKTYDFWRKPYGNSSASVGGIWYPDPLVAPTSLLPGSPERAGSVAVLNTQIAMGLLLSVPLNRTTLQQAKEGMTETLAYTTADITKTNGGVSNQIISGSSSYMLPELPQTMQVGVVGSPGDPKEPAKYVEGVQISNVDATTKQPLHWRFINTSGSPVNNPPPTNSGTGNSSWAPVAQPSPLYLDGWGNPIIFVPGSGLMVRMKDRISTNPNNPKGATHVVAPGKRPFFASAGPDGDMSTGDDNVYSFEQE